MFKSREGLPFQGFFYILGFNMEEEGKETTFLDGTNLNHFAIIIVTFTHTATCKQ